jgi:hypothetical protein
MTIKRCQLCNKPAEFMSREKKGDPPIFLCKEHAFTHKYLSMGVVSYHGNLPPMAQQVQSKKSRLSRSMQKIAVIKGSEEVSVDNEDIDDEDIDNESIDKEDVEVTPKKKESKENGRRKRITRPRKRRGD